MCLVSYIPTTSGFILSSNRDETPLRSDTLLIEEQIGGHQITYPKDKKGGSWIFLSDTHTCICILNGAFKNHKRHLPYRMSRGLMMKHYFDYTDTKSFLQNFDFTNIEPFTMIIKDSNGLYEFRWDEMNKHIKIMDQTVAQVWSSSTLYPKEIRDQREKLFFELSNNQSNNLSSIQDIHLTGNLGDDRYNFKMHYNDIVATISHTNIVVDNDSARLLFQNLITGENQTLTV